MGVVVGRAPSLPSTAADRVDGTPATGSTSGTTQRHLLPGACCPWTGKKDGHEGHRRTYTPHPICTSLLLARGGDGLRDGIGRERSTKSQPATATFVRRSVSQPAGRRCRQPRSSARPTFAAAAHAPSGRRPPAPAVLRRPPSDGPTWDPGGGAPPARRSAELPLRRGRRQPGGDVGTASLRS